MPGFWDSFGTNAAQSMRQTAPMGLALMKQKAAKAKADQEAKLKDIMMRLGVVKDNPTAMPDFDFGEWNDIAKGYRKPPQQSVAQDPKGVEDRAKSLYGLGVDAMLKNEGQYRQQYGDDVVDSAMGMHRAESDKRAVTDSKEYTRKNEWMQSQDAIGRRADQAQAGATMRSQQGSDDRWDRYEESNARTDAYRAGQGERREVEDKKRSILADDKLREQYLDWAHDLEDAKNPKDKDGVPTQKTPESEAKYQMLLRMLGPRMREIEEELEMGAAPVSEEEMSDDEVLRNMGPRN